MKENGFTFTVTLLACLSERVLLMNILFFLSLQNKESGSTESVEDKDDDAKASGNDSPVHSSHPIKIDADPMGEPVVAKMVH